MAEENFHKYLKDIRKHLDLGDAREGTHRPALAIFIESLLPKIIASNEPAHIAVGGPDFNIRRDKLLIGHIECKDVGKDLRAELKTDQLKRYLANLPNLILTDYIDFIWFREGKEIDKAHIARRDSKGKLKLDTEELPRLERLLINFLKVEPAEIGDSRKLAEEMARPARMIRDTIREIFALEEEEGPLHGQLAAFREVLLPDLSPHDFADMYAQTIAYGLFAAKTDEEEIGLEPDKFTWEHAFHHLPKSNPFLQSLFSRMMSPDNREPRIIPWVEELTALLGRSDMRSIKKDFGKKTRQEDPVVHFYETFIGAYDPKMKKSRGIYYTPQPVVSYIVRSIDYLLKEKFGRKLGLADENVYILDPACGTGSFLLEVVKLIYEDKGISKSVWPDYVKRKLLPRLFGFELLVAPYTIAHLKLGLYLKETGFEFGADERLGIYLTNTLEPEVHGQLGFARIIAEEGKRAQKVKKEEPIMVVLGNPPYSGHSANNGEWILDAIRDYYFVDGEPIKERNPKYLRDDYVKFLRFAQWRIEKTGYGILGMITNHGYIDNPTFPGMRRELMNTFNEIYILDLHGNSLKKERCPDGSEDQNVFDIKDVGVAISIWVKEEDEKRSNKVSHSDLWGLRDAKYAELSENDINTVKWTKVLPRYPDYLFLSQDKNLRSEFQKGWKITEIFTTSSNGFKTHRDHFAIAFTKDEINKRIKFLLDKEKKDNELAEMFRLNDTRDWELSTGRSLLQRDSNWKNRLVPCTYRPLDLRYCLYGIYIMDWPREAELFHALYPNFCMAVGRQGQAVGGDEWNLITSGKYVADTNLFYRGGIQYFPLYLYPTPKKAGQQEMHQEEIEGRKPNLAPEFIAELEAKLRVTFIPSLTPGPSPKGRGEPKGEGCSSPLPPGEELEVREKKTPLPEEMLKRCRELRKSQTPAEAKLWACLKNRQLFGTKFRRQHPIGKFIVDFYCHEAKLAIELDGCGHAEEKQAEYDEERSKCLEEEGIKVLRFWNTDVQKNLEGVIEAIAAALPLPPGEGLRVRERNLPHPQPFSQGEKGVEGRGGYVTPEDVFYYIYAVLHSPTYRSRYAEFLKIDFPRVPLTSSLPLFRKLVEKGKALTELHLMESDKLADPSASKVDLNAHPELKNEVVKVSYDEKHKRVYINKGQYFSGVEPRVWNFHVGGYQVCHKWLKDRKGRKLNYDDITHYQKIVIALRETIKLMESIDKAIPSWPIR